MESDLQLARNSFGQLTFVSPDGQEYVDVRLARAFPIIAPREGIALLSSEGHELAWIDQLDELPAATRQLVEGELESREFMPEILRLREVSGYAMPCTWQVQTDRGDTALVLKAEEDIRRLSGTALLVVDSRGIQFLIRNPQALDATSRKFLDRFL